MTVSLPFPPLDGTTASGAQELANLQALVAGINNALSRDGTLPATGDLSMGGFRVTGAGTGIGDTDAIVLGQASPTSLTAFQALDTRARFAIYAGSVWAWQTASPPYVADGINVIKANSTALSVGAWVRQTVRLSDFPGSSGLPYQQREFVATAGQTAFAFLYAPLAAYNSVYINGALRPSTDFTLAGSTITLTTPLVGGEHVTIAGFLNGAVADAAAITYGSRTAAAKLDERISVKDYGAKGDGTTNDTQAFADCAAYINAIGGGTIYIPPGTYIVGVQDANAGSPVQAWLGRTLLKIQNCTKPVVIEGNGAKLKFADGLRMGSFNGTTPYNPSMPFTDLSKRADPGAIIELRGNASVTVNNLELDGNLANHVMGGTWGDYGWQCFAVGVFSYGNGSLTCNNVYAHDFGEDGITHGYLGLAETDLAKPCVLINCRFEYNGRQGLSWIGGNSLTAIGCKFNHTGRRVNTGLGTALTSAPSAGLDIEAESAIIRNGDFINCEFVNNAGPGMVADAGDSQNIRFRGCAFIGTTNYSIWPNKPNMVFEDCFVYGSVVNQASSLDRQQATKFVRTRFSDETFAGYSAYLSGGQLFASQLSAPVYYDECTFVTTKGKLGRLDFAYLEKCKHSHTAGTAYISDTDFVAILVNAELINCRFDSNITVGAPATGYYYSTNAATIARGDNIVTNTAGNLFFNSYLLAGGGVLGNLGERLPNDVGRPALRLFRNQNPDARQGNMGVYAGTAVPTTGTWQQGDVMLNQAPSPSGTGAWVCTASGTPGTWKVLMTVGA